MSSMTGVMQCCISAGDVHIAVDLKDVLKLTSSTESILFHCHVAEKQAAAILVLPVESAIEAVVISGCLTGFVSSRFGVVSVSNESLSGSARKLLSLKDINKEEVI